MVLTKKELLLGLPGEEEVRDHIPLHEIEQVIISQDNDEDRSARYQVRAAWH